MKRHCRETKDDRPKIYCDGIHPTLEADLGCLSSILGKNIPVLSRRKSPAFMALSRARKRGVSTVTKRWARGAMGASRHKASDAGAHG
jgi:hypothetical protein